MPPPPPKAPPPFRPTPGVSRADRVGTAVCAGACLCVLAVAAWLNPSAAGHGTHTQMGLPSCQWVQAFDRPCPTCGMTTSFAYAANGSFLRSAAAQPLGMLLAIATAAIFWGALHAAITGSRAPHVALHAANGRSLLALLGLGLVAWVYKLATWGG